MDPDISEFSYGYALTEELIPSSRLPLRAAPLFPSLIKEGKTGGGYDVKIPFPGFPLFLQFKLSHCMVRATVCEATHGLLQLPFYRMYLRPGKHSRQHQMLLALEGKGEVVYYAAPHFHLPDELNDAYLYRRVADRSMFIKPSEIGSLPDDDWHHVAFRDGSPVYLCSEPREIRQEGRSRSRFEGDLLEGLRARRRLDGTWESLARLSSKLFECIEPEVPRTIFKPEQRSALRERHPRFQIAYICRAFLGCELLIVGERENATEV